MDSKFSLGLFIGFILGGIGFVIGASQWVGIALLCLAAVWGFLFVNPKSPLRKRWWSVSSRLGIVLITIMGVSDRYLTIYVGLRAISVIQVEKIVLKIRGKSLLSDWQTKRVEADEQKYINFVRPDWLCVGEYKAILIAYTTDGFSKSEGFLAKVDS